MADNTRLSAGTADGVTIATDELTGGEHVQFVKLMSGTLNDDAKIPGDATNGLDVDVTRLPALAAGTNNIGDVDVLTFPPEVHSADFDSGGGTDTTLAFGIAVPASGGAAVIPGSATDGLLVNLGSNNDVTVTGTVDLGATDNAVLDSIDADLTTIIGHVDGIEGLLTTMDADTGNIATSVQLLDDVVFTDDAAFTPGTSKVAAIGAQADETAPDSVDEGDIGALRMTLDRLLKVTSFLETSAIYAAGTACTPKFAVIDNASSGDNTLVAAVTSKKIRVLQAALVATAAVNVRFESGAGGTALTGVINLAANGGFVLPFSPIGWFETASNTLLNLELSGATSVDGVLAYIEV